MPRIAQVFSNPTLKIATDQASIGTGLAVECQIVQAELVADVQMATIPPTKCAGPSDSPSGSKWSLNLTWLQDWGTDGMSDFAFDHHQEQIYFEMVLDETATPVIKFAGDAWCVTGSAGGTWGDGSAGQSTATWPLLDKPVKTSTP